MTALLAVAALLRGARNGSSSRLSPRNCLTGLANIAADETMRYPDLMDAEKFVVSLRDLVAVPAGDGTLTQIERPSGRNVAADRTARAAWLAALSSEDRAHVEYAVREVANAALFGLLCLLDDARVIEDEPRGHLELHYRKDSSDTLLSSSDLSVPAPSLHELFRRTEA